MVLWSYGPMVLWSAINRRRNELVPGVALPTAPPDVGYTASPRPPTRPVFAREIVIRELFDTRHLTTKLFLLKSRISANGRYRLSRRVRPRRGERPGSAPRDMLGRAASNDRDPPPRCSSGPSQDPIHVSEFIRRPSCRTAGSTPAGTL
jgi:hypothetical protein